MNEVREMPQKAEGGVNPSGAIEREKALDKHFESIVKVVFSKTKTEVMKAAARASTNNVEFIYNNMDLTTLLEEINNLKNNALIIKNGQPKTSKEQLYIAEFADKYGLGSEELDQVVSKFIF